MSAPSPGRPGSAAAAGAGDVDVVPADGVRYATVVTSASPAPAAGAVSGRPAGGVDITPPRRRRA